jgi:CDP-glucose 4,6-dehydratase
MSGKFWENKKVLITGHTGFKGSWLSLWLQAKRANAIGYALPPPTKPNLFEVANVEKEMVSIIGDIRDSKNLQTVFTEHRPEIVIHLAAKPLVRYSYNYPLETYSTNVMGTINVLEAVRQSNSVEVAVIITSDKCYENREWLWGYREDEAMGGHDPYSSSKGCAELVASAYRRSYFSDNNSTGHQVHMATTRAGNVVGGGDWAEDRLIPDIMKALMENRPPFIRYPHAIRPWQHVLEPLRGYLGLAEKLWHHGKNFTEAWNFGPNDEDSQSVAWVADRIISLWGEGARWEADSAHHPHESTYLKLDCSKAKSLLGWVPQLDLTTALNWIVEWYKAYLQKKDMRQFTQTQISRYERMPQD